MWNPCNNLLWSGCWVLSGFSIDSTRMYRESMQEQMLWWSFRWKWRSCRASTLNFRKSTQYPTRSASPNAGESIVYTTNHRHHLCTRLDNVIVKPCPLFMTIPAYTFLHSECYSTPANSSSIDQLAFGLHSSSKTTKKSTWSDLPDPLEASVISASALRGIWSRIRVTTLESASLVNQDRINTSCAASRCAPAINPQVKSNESTSRWCQCIVMTQFLQGRLTGAILSGFREGARLWQLLYAQVNIDSRKRGADVSNLNYINRKAGIENR